MRDVAVDSVTCRFFAEAWSDRSACSRQAALEQRVLGLRARSAFGLQALESSAQAHLQLVMLICLRAGQVVAHVVKSDFAIHGSCFNMLVLVLLSIMLACILMSGEIVVAAF